MAVWFEDPGRLTQSCSKVVKWHCWTLRAAQCVYGRTKQYWREEVSWSHWILWIKRNQELLQHSVWAVAEWLGGIINQFFNDTSMISHGRVWTWWAILGQHSNGCERCAQCDVQGVHQNDSVHVIVRKEEGYSEVQGFRMQCLCIFDSRTERKGQAHSLSCWSN